MEIPPITPPTGELNPTGGPAQTVLGATDEILKSLFDYVDDVRNNPKLTAQDLINAFENDLKPQVTKIINTLGGAVPKNTPSYDAYGALQESFQSVINFAENGAAGFGSFAGCMGRFVDTMCGVFNAVGVMSTTDQTNIGEAFFNTINSNLTADGLLSALDTAVTSMRNAIF